MSDVLINTRGNVLEITLNRPDKGNALTPEMAQAITAALKSLSPETRVVLMNAKGGDFCTGRSAAMPAAGSRAT
ncbi:enoyl-CoA hydratase/isomerase family protein, partial [Neorhizobium sp. SHOUNA12B]